MADDDLRVEGIARELIRTIQDGRKSAGLEISDRIVLAIHGSKMVQDAVEHHRSYIMSETLALELSESLDQGFKANHSLGEESWEIVLARKVDT